MYCWDKMDAHKKLRSKMDVRRQLLRYCTMYGMKNMDEQKVALVYNALEEQDGWNKKCCADVPWIKHGCTLEIMHSRTLYLLLIAGWSMNTRMYAKGPQSEKIKIVWKRGQIIDLWSMHKIPRSNTKNWNKSATTAKIKKKPYPREYLFKIEEKPRGCSLLSARKYI